MAFSWCFGKKSKEQDDEVEDISGTNTTSSTSDESWAVGSDNQPRPNGQSGEGAPPRRGSRKNGSGRPADCELESIADEYMVESISRAASRETSKGSRGMAVRDWYEEENFELGTTRPVPGLINWKKGELLGVGAFGKVYLGLNLDSGELMAVKTMPTALDDDDEQTTELVREISLMKVLFHENIVRYIGTQRDDHMLHIFLEYVPGGSIAAVLQKFGSLSDNAVRAYTKQILEGLAYLHAHKIMHRDIKGANILVSNNGIIKLADFGASKKITEMLTQYDCKSLKGTPYWMAPEVIMQAGHGRSADIWSVGATVVEMLTGKPPYSEFPTQVSVLFHIASTQEPPTLPPSIAEDCHNFLMLCFQRNPKNRPTAKALLDHPFLNNISSKDSQPATPMVAPNPHRNKDTSPKPVTQEWFAAPAVELPSPVIKPPVRLPNSRTNSYYEDTPTGARQVSSYLNGILQENEKQLSGDFRQSLKLLMTKPNRGKAGVQKQRRMDPSATVSGELSVLGSMSSNHANGASNGASGQSRNSSADHQTQMASPGGSRHVPLPNTVENQPIMSAYTKKIMSEQSQMQAQIDAEAASKIAQHTAWQQELDRAKPGE
eukprot:TRINITY_DN345_c0_g1_i4.p1 TRINITY_DN345_c0_g1~~TRINITY_DN345_c0_g1_i4.p1  ORF type:complete len:604 (-),score=78.02 TRINITY_DN345_c0_g1_i4:61-1872(-)